MVNAEVDPAFGWLGGVLPHPLVWAKAEPTTARMPSSTIGFHTEKLSIVFEKRDILMSVGLTYAYLPGAPKPTHKKRMVISDRVPVPDAPIYYPDA